MGVDYVVVGFGIAGMCLTFQLESQGKSVLVIDGKQTKASIVAAGVFNPVVLKRFTLAWQAESQMSYASHFYNDLSVYLRIATTQKLPIFRKFNDAEEQNKWFSKIDNPALSKYLSPYLKTEISKAIEGPYKFGEVKNTGRVLIAEIFEAYKKKLKPNGRFLSEEFDFSKLEVYNDRIQYNTINASKIIFCEGHMLKLNPFFNHLPLVGSKGSYLIVKSPNLKLHSALKSYYFLIPLGNDLYKFGATYGHQFKDNHDEQAKQELIDRLDQLIDVPYQIIDFVVGVRPTTKDRRPLLGQHPQHKPLYVMNGMGTRGVLLAPTASLHMLQLIEKGGVLPAEMDINRFV